MATAYTQIYEYKDPVQLDISNTLGKAATYKQNQYDTNTAEIQKLVNQYVGMDLLRDIDQNYLGDRLKTLTNYVNQAGALDWSRRKVFDDVSNYIGQALDSNVMAGVVSTRRYRTHQAQMEDLKKNKPELYGTQNDWMATRDLDRYMSSNQLGDIYKQGSYVPYTDVKKELLENSKYLKDFGVESYIDSTDGNVYFKTIKTGERLTKEKANQYVDMVLGEKGKTQLMIDGIYSYRNVGDDDLKGEYNKYISNISDNYTKSAKALRLKAVNSPKNIKERLNQEADSLDAMANNALSAKGLLTDRDSIASNLYINRFKQQWSDMLSFDRIKDWKIDDSGMQIAKFNQQVNQDNISNSLKAAGLEIDNQKLKIDQNRLALDQSKLTAELMSKGLTMDADGNIVEDTNSARNPLYNGMTVTQDSKNLEEVEMTPALQTFKDYDTAYGMAIKDGSSALTATLNNPQYADLKKELGFEGKDAKYIINSMIINPSGYGKLMNVLDANTKDLIRNAAGAYKEKENLKKTAEPIYKEVQRISNGIYASPDSANSFKNNVNLFQGGLSIDEKGNLVQKDVRKSNTLNDRKVREIGVINSMIAQGEKLDDDEKALLYQKQLDILKSMKLTNAQYKEAKDKLIYSYNGFWGGMKSNIAAGIQAIPGLMIGLSNIDNTINYLNRDNKSAGKSYIAGTIMEEAAKSDLANNSLVNANNQSSNRRGAYGFMLDQFNDLGRPNYDVEDAGDTDLPGVVDASTTMDRVKGTLRLAKEQALQSRGKINFMNNVNVDLSSDVGKQIISNIKANLPIGSEIQKDGNIQFQINPETGLATVTAPVKNGKEIEPMQIEIPIQNLPPQVLGRVNLNKQQYLYSANNPNSIGYSGYSEIPASQKDWRSQIDFLPVSERTDAENNPPKTQEDILKELEMTFGKDIVTQNKAEIKDIIDRPVDFQMVSEGGQWTVVGKQGNEVIMRKPTGQEYIDPNLIDKHINKLGTEKIIENVKLLLRNKQ